jgi:hypothetical protein
VAAELGESVVGEEESWHAMAVDIVKKMKEIKRCDIIDFSLGPPLVGAGKSCGQIRHIGKLLKR